MKKKQKYNKPANRQTETNILIPPNTNMNNIFLIIDSEHKTSVHYCQIIAVVFTVLNTLLIAHLNASTVQNSDMYKYLSMMSLFFVFLTLITSYNQSSISIKRYSQNIHKQEIEFNAIVAECIKQKSRTLRWNFWIILCSFILLANTSSIIFIGQNLFSASYTGFHLIFAEIITLFNVD